MILKSLATLGENHRATATSYNNLASAYQVTVILIYILGK